MLIYNYYNVKKNIINLVFILEVLVDFFKFLFFLICCFVVVIWVLGGGGDVKMLWLVIVLVLELDNCFFLFLELVCVCIDLFNFLSFVVLGEGVVVGFLGVVVVLLFFLLLKDIWLFCKNK